MILIIITAKIYVLKKKTIGKIYPGRKAITKQTTKRPPIFHTRELKIQYEYIYIKSA